MCDTPELNAMPRVNVMTCLKIKYTRINVLKGLQLSLFITTCIHIMNCFIVCYIYIFKNSGVWTCLIREGNPSEIEGSFKKKETFTK